MKSSFQASPRRRAMSAVIREPEMWISKVILVTIIVLSSTQVILRYVFNHPLDWPEELSSSLLIWLTFLGATAVTRRGLHVRVELLEEFIGKKVTRWLYPLYDVVIIVFLAYLVRGGWEQMLQMQYSRTPALRIPLNYILAIVPISAFIMGVYYVRSVAHQVSEIVGRPKHGH